MIENSETIVMTVPIWIVWFFIVLITANVILKLTSFIFEVRINKLKRENDAIKNPTE